MSGDILSVRADLDAGTLSFAVNGKIKNDRGSHGKARAMELHLEE